MAKFELMNNVTRTFGKLNFQLKKHSPEILVVAGVVGVVTSAVMACKATTKVNDILEESKTKVDQIHGVLADDSKRFKEVEENGEMTKVEVYSEEDSKKDLAIVYVQTAAKFAKLYGPSIVLGALSITSILASNNILRKRNVALAAAYATVDKSFKDYRSRVVERFGKELDRELKYNLKSQEIEETVVDEKGEEKTVKKTVNMVNTNHFFSEYAKFFDESCPDWTKDPERNRFFLTRQQDYANDKLKARGYLFLNEVYEMLGVPRTKAGQIVGWIYDKDVPNGDNYVDFGIFNAYSEQARDFVNGYERTILLDFNVDGNILDLVEDRVIAGW